MAFSLTFQSILDNNIRHIYSGTPSNMAYRHSKEYPNMDQLRQQKDNQYLKDYVLRVSEYRADYRCLVPRAPAFRILSRHEVDDIVERLNTPRSRNADKDEQKPRQGERQVSKEEAEAITERLYGNVTKATTVRVNQTRDAGHPPLTKIEV
ncbi:uncharacterized protein LOC124275834 [Haliotis rubra]|uniref:uncharacterized protein LOC124275834 n=1 Tax=Haliotis rubra TaxID=36100 RepID=UPI001EE59C96|nr:uncharacterized protein LOC124275834 [Haliotis rubra]